MKHDGGWERMRNRHLQIQSDFAKEAKGGIGARISAYAAALQVTAETAVQAGILPDAYLKVIPEDPTTKSTSTWVTATSDALHSLDQTDPGIDDVHSGSQEIGTDGQPYSSW